MEIRHHTINIVKRLINRARVELEERFYDVLKSYYKYVVSIGHSIDTVYVELSKCLVFLKYVQELGKGLDDLEVEDINEFLASKRTAGTRRWYVNVIRNLAKAVKITVRFSKSEPRTVFIVKYAHVLRDWLR